MRQSRAGKGHRSSSTLTSRRIHAARVGRRQRFQLFGLSSARLLRGVPGILRRRRQRFEIALRPSPRRPSYRDSRRRSEVLEISACLRAIFGNRIVRQGKRGRSQTYLSRKPSLPSSNTIFTTHGCMPSPCPQRNRNARLRRPGDDDDGLSLPFELFSSGSLRPTKRKHLFREPSENQVSALPAI